MIMTGYDEPLMEIEASRYSAEFVRKPIKPAEFLENVARCLARCDASAAGRASGSRGLSRDGGGAAGRGARGRLRRTPPGDSLDASMPPALRRRGSGIDLRLEVEPVWSYPAPGGEALVCGAALASDTTAAARTWRTIVDRLRA